MAGGDVYTSFLDKSRVNHGHHCRPQIVGGSDFALDLAPANPKPVTAGENPGIPCIARQPQADFTQLVALASLAPLPPLQWMCA